MVGNHAMSQDLFSARRYTASCTGSEQRPVIPVALYVSDAIYKAEWSEECYLIGNGKIDGITAPIEREYLQEAA